MSDWAKLDRFSKLASAMFPDLVPPERRKEMDAIARREGKSLRGPNLISDKARKHLSPLGGEAKPWPAKKG
jgi:hypothetical protein